MREQLKMCLVAVLYAAILFPSITWGPWWLGLVVIGAGFPILRWLELWEARQKELEYQRLLRSMKHREIYVRSKPDTFGLN
jgi:hypothetical protein